MYCHVNDIHAQVLPVLHDEGEEVRHGGGPQLAQRVVIEAGIQADHLKLDTFL